MSERVRWEYLVEEDADLDVLGARGWELVSVLRIEWEDKDGYEDSLVRFYFKRPLT